MGRLNVTINTKYGKITVSGDSPKEILESIDMLTQDFLDQITDRLTLVELKDTHDKLKNIIHITQSGPVIVSREDLNHYESIGLILYAMKNHEATSKKLRERLEASGKNIIVAARLNEMRKRGHIFRPGSKGSEYKLTSKGLAWVDEGVIGKMKKNSIA
jgi:phosphoglycerate-specific signal transduction histidine kinase